MGIIEKIVLTIIVYMLLMIYIPWTFMTYLSLANKPLSIGLTTIVMILFYTLALIEEQ